MLSAKQIWKIRRQFYKCLLFIVKSHVAVVWLLLVILAEAFIA
jgi:hypothetical protein